MGKTFIDNTAHLDFDVAINIDTMSLGTHELSIRACDTFGQWTDVMSRQFEVVEGSTEPVIEMGDLARMEYFFDTDPGYGKATLVAVPGSLDDAFAFVGATDGLSKGKHRLCVRAKGLDGLWSLVSSSVFTVSDSLKGDVNGDGAVDVADIATVISVMAGSVGSGLPAATAADVNGDGAVDVADIATIISEMAARARMREAMEE